MTVELYHGDCLTIMPTIDASKIDSVIADPPYGVRYSPKQNDKNAWGNKTFVGDIVVTGDDVEFDPEPFLDFPVVVLFGANHYAEHLPSSPEWIIWDKRNGVASDDFADCEMIWTNQTGVARVYSHLWRGAIRASERGVPRVHPTQKPIALMEYLIERYTLPDQTILDPFMGSGTTGVACAKLGRNFIGIEIEKKWFDIASRRISEAQAQLIMNI